ncbi:isochorismate synthase [Rhizobium paknamense]|uniref:isochorismate synthase n=1 Tax=Rhizobium paknamense TaxID=1206817 RepID=A0ABU0IHP2_9HYPH|nr:isochorismate synthase [Rhizobium paknamense]MDQ0457774.1 isochorismate synthase [Rhizobium paknamense]
MASFNLKTPDYHLRTRGIAEMITPSRWDGPSVAASVHAALQARRKEGSNRTASPVVVGMIPFDTNAPALLYVPEEVEWNAEPAALGGVEAAALQPVPLAVDHADSPAYREGVARLLEDIEQGALEKAVLARRVEVRFDKPVDTDRVYARLCARNPSAYVFQADVPEDAAFGDNAGAILLGASPELVVGCRRGRVSSKPLAGSTPRLADQAADEAARHSLLQSAKDQAEHALVVQAIGEVFHRYARDVVVPEQPDLVETPVIWHLGSHVSGVLREGVCPLTLAYALHPTPAVSGWPQRPAQEAIARLEDFDRGFYAGLIGWMDADGNADWALTLRCGFIKGCRATAYAGAGIVAGSTPEKEHAETATKLKTFINAL